MKRELTLQFGQQEITVTAHREGNAIVVSRGEDTFTVTITGEKIIGSTVAVAPAPAAAAPAPSRPAVAPSSAAAPATPAGGPGVVPSPMTGVVDKILVQDGTVVAEGEKVLILEAMKMYIDVTAPASGTVSGIAVKSGDSIKEGQALMTIQ
jgi:biotin carboxyl carrier protein